MELTKQLLEFRTTYLRAIAKAWNDKDFRTKLCAPGNALTVMSKYFGYECPWNIVFSIKDLDEGPFFNELRGVYMTDSLSFDKFIITIPKKPSIPFPAEALSQYYSANSWLLEEKNNQSETKNNSLDALLNTLCYIRPDNSKLKNASSDLFPSMKNGAIPSASYDLGNSNTHFVEFGGVLMAAVALAWSNKIFKDQFIESEISSSASHTIGKIPLLLREWLDYDYPWDVDLIIREDDCAYYARTFSATVTLKGGTEHNCKVAFKLNNENYNLSLNELVTSFDDYLFSEGHSISKGEIESISIGSNTIPLDQWVWCQEISGNYSQIQKTPLGIVLSLPEAPDSKDVQPVALTRYNNDGPGFPFTC